MNGEQVHRSVVEEKRWRICVTCALGAGEDVLCDVGQVVASLVEIASPRVEIARRHQIGRMSERLMGASSSIRGLFIVAPQSSTCVCQWRVQTRSQ